ncbi:hypothetical protein K493DRAFT_338397 [Basidiobolus meristosporus CBS 931.73]|uniref:Carrier domain-containing protein n=1 Tax=Basidiobolus meristosporus CBS 931.73 TaxID=1314790 RepID=A0A1Y1Y5C0_9FUNG|nr:hypothetical protein K493DRAFT_338397 [Basidiobolus meristosporus CBS 931.73]|eukprot:ORX93212.1 hypothetical protein K493DRAFT_338397 [Basidiobolus meristosporus CBS 931.73]
MADPHQSNLLSLAQEHLVVLHELQPESSAYNVPLCIKIKNTLSIKWLIESFMRLVKRHASLRSFLTLKNGEPYQKVVPISEFMLPLETINLEQDRREAQRLLAEFISRPFDLYSAPLFRALLLKLEDQEYHLILSMHHIITDGWTCNILLKELFAFYQYLSIGIEPVLPTLDISYADFALHQRRWVDGGEGERQMAYWKELLSNAPSISTVSPDHSRPQYPSYRGGACPINITGTISPRLKKFSESCNTSSFVVLLAVYQLLLHQYCNSDRIVVGTVTSGRNHPDIQNLAGYFANTLAIPSTLVGTQCFKKFVQKVNDVFMEAIENQDVPFQQVVQEMLPNRDPSIHPLFQTMFVLQDDSATPANTNLDISILPIHDEIATSAKFDLTMELVELGNQLTGTVTYSKDLYEESTVIRLLKNYEFLLSKLLDSPDIPLTNIQCITPEELCLVTDSFNNTQSEMSDTECLVHELFERWAKRNPDQLAVELGEDRISYRTLDEKSSSLAIYLQSQRIQPGDTIALFTERSIEMIIGILGILKSGGAYVPIDATLPQSRIRYMIENAECKLLVTSEKLKQRLPLENELPVILVNGPEMFAIGELSHQPRSTDLAYVIYTSGSTGLPKGVMVEHQGICNLAQQAATLYNICPLSRVMQFFSIGFDGCAWEIFNTLCNGGTLVLRDENFFHALSQVDTVFTTPSALLSVQPEDYPNLVCVVVGGEPCPPSLSTTWSMATRFCNAYGPTEVTVCSNVAILQAGERINVGSPLHNVQCYILNHSLTPLPIGAIGELYIGGVGVARGYINNQALTQSNFIPNPFNYGRLYKTGDLARWMDNGKVEVLGRSDRQVKLRGFRIELDEIEFALSALPMVQNSAVILHEQKLHAFLTPSTLNTDRIKMMLQKCLPLYMVPSVIDLMDCLPQTSNGKVHYAALRPTGLQKPTPVKSTSLKLPYSIHGKLVQLWSETLGISKDDIDIKDNFFELGGNSIAAMRMHHLSKSIITDLVFDVPTLYRYPTIYELGNHLMSSLQDFSIDFLNQNDQPMLALNGAAQDLCRKITHTLPPVFLIHGSDGGSSSFIPLSAAFQNSCPLFAFQYVKGVTPVDSVIQYATFCVDRIQSVQPYGPYTIVGYSSGTMIAYEIAKQLQTACEQVKKLIFIDSSPSLTLSSYRDITAFDSQSLEQSIEAMNIFNHEQYEYFRASKLMYSSYQLLRRSTYVGHVVLVKAESLVENREGNPVLSALHYRSTKSRTSDLGLSSYCADPVEILTVPGNHNTLLQESRDQIAEIILS